jgi:hypothetical protein
MTPDGEAAAFLARWVEETHWRFAKTYVGSYPHEYTLKRFCTPQAHARVLALVEELGVVEPFLDSRRKYLYFGDRKFWHMGNPASPDPTRHCDVINRTWLDVSRYRDDARRLGFDGPELEGMVRTWHRLLRRARREADDSGLNAGAGNAPARS